MPVFHECDLRRQRDRTFHAQVRVAPVSNLGIASQVFVSDVETADPGLPAVDHHDFSVIAKVDLEAVRAPADRVERAHLNAFRAHPVDTAPGQIVAADFVVQEIGAHAGAHAIDETLLKLTSDLIVAKNVELH